MHGECLRSLRQEEQCRSKKWCLWQQRTLKWTHISESPEMHTFQSNKSHCVNELGKPFVNRKDCVVYVMHICHYWFLFSSDYIDTT